MSGLIAFCLEHLNSLLILGVYKFGFVVSVADTCD